MSWFSKLLRRSKSSKSTATVKLVTIDGKMLLYAIKEGSHPTEDEVSSMLKASVFGPTVKIESDDGSDNVPFHIYRFTYDELTDLAGKLGIPQHDRIKSMDYSILSHGLNLVREQGKIKEGVTFDVRTLPLWEKLEGSPKMRLLTIAEA